MSLASVKEALRRLRWRRERMEHSASVHSKRQSRKKNSSHPKYPRDLPFGHKTVLQHVFSLVMDFVTSDSGVCVLNDPGSSTKTPTQLVASRRQKTVPPVVLNAMEQQQRRAEVREPMFGNMEVDLVDSW